MRPETRAEHMPRAETHMPPGGRIVSSGACGWKSLLLRRRDTQGAGPRRSSQTDATKRAPILSGNRPAGAC